MRRLGYFLVIFCGLSLLYSCGKDTDFDKSLLPGKWQNEQRKTEFERYISDGTGKSWDEADDVTEAEAQKFEWTLDQADLTVIYLGTGDSSGIRVPKLYKITELTSTNFKYKDDDGTSQAFQKVE